MNRFGYYLDNTNSARCFSSDCSLYFAVRCANKSLFDHLAFQYQNIISHLTDLNDNSLLHVACTSGDLGMVKGYLNS